MRSLAGSLADGVLVDAILIPLRPLIPPTNIRKVRGPRKKLRKLVRQKPFTGMKKEFSKKYRNKG